MSALEKLSEDIKWIGVGLKYCYECRARKTHRFGTQVVDGREESVQQCGSCQTLTEEPKP